MSVREPLVRTLMDVMSDALSQHVQQHRDITADEVVSAYLTLARAAIVAARRLGSSSEALQCAVQQLLLDCLDDTMTRQ